MNILREYTLDYIKRNKKNSIAIMIAILLATTMLSALCGVLYTFYTDEVRLLIEERGNWHAELFDDTPVDKLKYVSGHPNVESVMFKGPWVIASITDPRRPYLAIRGLNADYWRDMPERTVIQEGRVPQASNELALSMQYMEHHPELKIGDTLRLPIGSRNAAGAVIPAVDPWKEGESFTETDVRSYVLVGIMNITTNSITPAYMGFGYVEEAELQPDDPLTVYIRFKNPRSTYGDIERIAQSVGFKPDEYGDYRVKTNRALLGKYLVFPPAEKGNLSLWMFSQQLTIATFAVLVAGVFVVIIHNAFAMSANARLKQLGMLQSIGASPRQIRRSVIDEGLLLAVIPIPFGLLIGWLLDYGLFAYMNSVASFRSGVSPVVFTYGLVAALPSVVLAVATVWLSALIPARRISKLTPIEAIRQGGDKGIKKLRRRRLTARMFGIEGELAQNALQARKKSYRTASVSLTLSFLLLTGFLHFMAVNELRNKVYYYDKLNEDRQHITLYTMDGNDTEPEFERQIRSIAGVDNVVFASNVAVALWLPAGKESAEMKAIGGLKSIAASGDYSVYETDGKFRIRSYLLTLDDKSFADYCRQIGADPAQFADSTVPRTIVVNKVLDVKHSNQRNKQYIPFLQLATGEHLQLEEKIYEEDTSKYAFPIEIGYLTDRMPAIGDRYDGYELVQVMPRSTYRKIAAQLEPTRSQRANSVFAPVTTLAADIQPVADAIQEVSEKWYGSGDFQIWNILEVRQADAQARSLINAIMIGVSGLLAFIGIANVFSTVSGNLRQRRKEFAMLRSVGLSPQRVKRMLMLEALIFGLTPILLSLPLNAVFVGIFLHINLLNLSEFLPFMPVLPILSFAAAILLAVVLAYARGAKLLRKDTIVEVLKSEA
jgi:putative ABC transport system permease protein